MMHNPANSYDFGTWMWGLGEPASWAAFMQYTSPTLPYVDRDTALFGYGDIARKYEEEYGP